MAIGLGTLRSARVGGRGAGAGTSHPTIREICLIGIDHRARDAGWTAGQEVSWLGRGYRVTATAAAPEQPVDDGSCPASPRHYVHLAPSNGD
jgi:hypothetical protein